MVFFVAEMALAVCVVCVCMKEKKHHDDICLAAQVPHFTATKCLLFRPDYILTFFSLLFTHDKSDINAYELSQQVMSIHLKAISLLSVTVMTHATVFGVITVYAMF